MAVDMFIKIGDLKASGSKQMKSTKPTAAASKEREEKKQKAVSRF
jgi:hypothetical protein